MYSFNRLVRLMLIGRPNNNYGTTAASLMEWAQMAGKYI